MNLSFKQPLISIRNALLFSPWPSRVIRVTLGLVFVYAGIIKLMDPKAFARSISGYDLVPEMLLPFLAVGLPALETVAGIGLIFDVAGSLAVIFGLLLLFAIVIWYGILNGLNIDCGCFSPEEVADKNSLQRAFYRDLLMIGSAVYLFLARKLRSLHSAYAAVRTENNSINGG